MLGSVSEAEDAVQEAWLRLDRAGEDGIENLRAWLTTVVGRVCIDMLRTRQSRHEDFVGTWLPEPDRGRGRRAGRPRAGGAAGRLGGPGAARGARDAQPRRAAGVRASRHVRGALRRDRADRGAHARDRAPARQPRAAAGAGGAGTRRRPGHAAARGRRISGGGAGGRLRRADGGARPRRRVPRRHRRAPRDRGGTHRGCRGGGAATRWPTARAGRAGAGRPWSTGAGAAW